MKRSVLIFLLLLCLGSQAQRIANLNLVLTQTIVTVRFTLTAGSPCGGYNVLHSIDQLNYFTIYNYAGICGNQAGAEEHKYDHYTPTLDAVNYYKIELIGVETSSAQSVFVPSVPKVSMQAYPNPLYNFTDMLTVRIFNKEDALYYGYVVHHNGHSKREIVVKTINEMASIPVNDLENGLYIIWLSDGERLYSTKFLVDR